MNLGHSIGSAVRETVRDATPNGAWHQLGSTAVVRVREVVERYDPIRHEVWITKDDERTCPICGLLNGRMWREGDGFVPPAHDHCRCVRQYHHTEFRKRFIEQWRDVAVPTVSWVWRTS